MGTTVSHTKYTYIDAKQEYQLDNNFIISGISWKFIVLKMPLLKFINYEGVIWVVICLFNDVGGYNLLLY